MNKAVQEQILQHEKVKTKYPDSFWDKFDAGMDFINKMESTQEKAAQKTVKKVKNARKSGITV